MGVFRRASSAGTHQRAPAPADHARMYKHFAPRLLRDGELRFGNEPAPHSRIFRSVHTKLHDPAISSDSQMPAPPRVHESSRGFSSFMCPACATPPVAESPGVSRRDPGFKIAGLPDGASTTSATAPNCPTTGTSWHHESATAACECKLCRRSIQSPRVEAAFIVLFAQARREAPPEA